MGFNGNLMGFYQYLMGFYKIYRDSMVYGGFQEMGIHSDLMGYGDKHHIVGLNIIQHFHRHSIFIDIDIWGSTPNI